MTLDSTVFWMHTFLFLVVQTSAVMYVIKVVIDNHQRTKPSPHLVLRGPCMSYVFFVWLPQAQADERTMVLYIWRAAFIGSISTLVRVGCDYYSRFRQPGQGARKTSGSLCIYLSLKEQTFGSEHRAMIAGASKLPCLNLYST